MADIKISVVVPVYNAADFLSGMLDALASQSFRDFEVILVDDGSTDESPMIVDRRCQQDGRFRALHIPNGGAYNARLTGIREARGAYIAFCDSDDLVRSDYLEKLYRRAEQTGADITVCGYTREDMRTGRTRSREMTVFGDRVYAYPALLDILPRVNSSVWNKLFRAALLRRAIPLEQPPRIAEDAVFICSFYPYLRKIAFLTDLLYRYRVRGDSALSRIPLEDCDRIRENMLRIREYVLRCEDSREMRELMDGVIFVHIGCSLVVFQINAGEPIGKTVASARKWLDQYAPGYKKAGRSFGWNRKHGNIQLRILILRSIFRARLMGPALLVYRFITRTFGVEIKW